MWCCKQLFNLFIYFLFMAASWTNEHFYPIYFFEGRRSHLSMKLYLKQYFKELAPFMKVYWHRSTLANKIDKSVMSWNSGLRLPVGSLFRDKFSWSLTWLSKDVLNNWSVEDNQFTNKSHLCCTSYYFCCSTKDFLAGGKIKKYFLADLFQRLSLH